MADKPKVTEVTVQVDSLVKALTRVREVTPKRHRTLPILEFAHMKANGDGKLRVAGTNQEQYLDVDVGGVGFVVGDALEVMLPLTQVMKFLSVLIRDGKKVAEKKVHLRVEGEGGGQRVLAVEVPDVGTLDWDDTPDVENFPPNQPLKEGVDHGTCNGHDFLLGLRCAAPAIAPEDTRPVLTCLGVNNQCIVGADGFRLHVYEHTDLGLGLPNDDAKEMVLIPANAVKLLLKLFKGEEKLDCKFVRKGAKASFEIDGMCLTTALTLGTFPNWRQLMPAGGPTKVSFSAPLMAQRLEMLDDSVEITRLLVDPTVENGEVLKISAREEGHKWNLTMPVKSEAPEKAGIAFNRKFLAEAVRLFSLCDLTFSSPSSPGLFKGDVQGLSVVVMPMFVQW